jgi:hypothetical protein
MKKYLIYPLAILVSIGSMALSCDDTADLFDITTDLEFSENFNLNSNGEVSQSLEKQETIDPSEASAFNSIKDRIKDLTIDRITYTITEEADGNNSDASLSVNLGYAASGSSQVTNLETITSALSEVGVEKEIQVSAADIETIRGLLLAGESMDIYASGTLENGPVNINVLFTVYTAVTAAP